MTQYTMTDLQQAAGWIAGARLSGPDGAGGRAVHERVEELEATAERSARALHEAREAQRAAVRGAARDPGLSRTW